MRWSDEYSTGASDPDTWSSVLVKGLILAILVHAFLFTGFYFATLNNYGAAYYDEIMPRTFQVEALEIDPKLLEDVEIETFDEAPPSKPIPDDTQIQIPDEQIAFESVMDELIATPAAPPSELPLIEDLPRMEAAQASSALSELQANAERMIEQDLADINNQLIDDRPITTPRPVLEIPTPLEGRKENIGLASNMRTELRGETGAPRVESPSFSNLDSLLSQTGPLRDGTAPILMPTDLLFAYDSYQLQQRAVASLTKLGQIIQKNPNSLFIIEGHTDAFGPDDYNRKLSYQRAAAVRNWLVGAMGINPALIEIRGLGESDLLIPATGTIEEQALNRRVEIVIRTRR